MVFTYALGHDSQGMHSYELHTLHVLVIYTFKAACAQCSRHSMTTEVPDVLDPPTHACSFHPYVCVLLTTMLKRCSWAEHCAHTHSLTHSLTHTQSLTHSLFSVDQFSQFSGLGDAPLP
jgi:hypothetical protein